MLSIEAVHVDETGEEVADYAADKDEDEQALKLSWQVVSFEETSMSIQINWMNSYQVSSGPERDVLRVRVLQNEHFFSESQQFIPIDAAESIKIRPQMPNNALSESYSKAVVGSQVTTSVTLFSNLAVNVLFSGTTTLWWGILHCIQIIAHFDLVNVQMPANATQMFKMLAQTATFNFVPTRGVIDEIENMLRIVNDKFRLTENFVDFEYYCSGPIRNLQIVFLAMVVLVCLPIVLLALKAALFWAARCNRVLNWLLGKLFFNAYIRFALVAYLQISLTCLIRFENFAFVTPSDEFHSIFASALFFCQLAFAAFALGYLQFRFANLG